MKNYDSFLLLFGLKNSIISLKKVCFSVLESALVCCVGLFFYSLIQPLYFGQNWPRINFKFDVCVLAIIDYSICARVFSAFPKSVLKLEPSQSASFSSAPLPQFLKFCVCEIWQAATLRFQIKTE